MGGYHIKDMRVALSASAVNHVINLGVSQFVSVAVLTCPSSRPSQFVSQSALAWSCLVLHLDWPFFLIAFPVFFPLPPTSSVKKLASHLEGEFISSIIYTIMLLQNIPHELLIRVRLFVNYTQPSRLVSLCVFMQYLCVSS